MPTAQATPASPSRCRTTAARPTAAWISTRPPNTMTVNVTSVNDAPAGTNNTVTTLEDTAYTFTAADFGFSDPNDAPANSLLAVKRCSALARDRDADIIQRRGGHRRPVRQRRRDMNTAGLLLFTPAANCQRRGLRELHVPGAGRRRHGQRRRRSRSSPTRSRSNVTAVNDAPAGTNKTVTTWRTRPTRSRRPTSASAIRATPRPTRCWR